MNIGSPGKKQSWVCKAGLLYTTDVLIMHFASLDQEFF